MFKVKYNIVLFLSCLIYAGYCNDYLYDSQYYEAKAIEHEENDVNVTFNEKYDYPFDIFFNNDNQVVNCSVTSSAFNCTLNLNSSSCASVDPNVSGWINSNRCQIRVNRIRDTYPRYWEVIAYDNVTNSILNRYSVMFYYETPLIMDTVSIIENATFLQYISINTTMQNCTVSGYNTEAILSIDSEDVKLLTESPVKDRIASVGRGKCGLKIIDSIEGDPSQYTFIAKDKNGRDYKRSFDVKFLKTKSVDEVHVLYPTTKITINCENKSPTYGKTGFCSLYNPNGELVKSGVKSCSVIVKVAAPDYGLWKCAWGLQENMKSIVNTIEIKYKDLQDIRLIQEDTGNYLRIGCAVINPNATLVKEQFCKMTDPQGTEYQITPTAATERITAVTLDLNNYVCSIEIKKPLLESEKGRWSCSIAGVGGMIMVDKVEELHYSKRIDRTTRDGNSHTILCKVPYSSNYCFITSPNGTKFESYKQNTSWIGECAFHIENINNVDNGTWNCQFSKRMGDPFDIIVYNLLVAERMMYYKEVDVDLGDKANLLCTTQGAAVKHCMFEAPTHDIYYIFENGVSETFNYYGNGLVNGDCGITIKKVEMKHNGQWKCTLKLFDITDDITALIFLTIQQSIFQTESTLATSLGIGFGVLIILIATFAFYFIRKRRNNRNNQSTSTNRQDENANVPLSTIAPSTYLLSNLERNRDEYIETNQNI